MKSDSIVGTKTEIIFFFLFEEGTKVFAGIKEVMAP